MGREGSSEPQRWIEAAVVLDNDPGAFVDCPVCGEAKLEVFDVPFGHEGQFERYMTCPSCHARNILLNRRH